MAATFAAPLDGSNDFLFTTFAPDPSQLFKHAKSTCQAMYVSKYNRSVRNVINKPEVQLR